MQVQYVYHCCLCLIFDQITIAQEQKYLRYSGTMVVTGQRESANPSYHHIGLLFSATFLHWFSLVSQQFHWLVGVEPRYASYQYRVRGQSWL